MIRRRRHTSKWSQEIVGAALFAVTIGGIVYWMNAEPEYSAGMECGAGDVMWSDNDYYGRSAEFGIKHEYYPGADCLTKGGLPCEDPPGDGVQPAISEIPPYSYYEKPPGAEFSQTPRSSSTGKVHPWVIGQMFESWGVGPMIGGGGSSGGGGCAAHVSEPGVLALLGAGLLLIGGLRKWK